MEAQTSYTIFIVKNKNKSLLGHQISFCLSKQDWQTFWTKQLMSVFCLTENIFNSQQKISTESCMTVSKYIIQRCSHNWKGNLADKSKREIGESFTQGQPFAHPNPVQIQEVTIFIDIKLLSRLRKSCIDKLANYMLTIKYNPVNLHSFILQLSQNGSIIYLWNQIDHVYFRS